MKASPSRRYQRFLPVLADAQLFDFGLRETELRTAPRLARWLGVSECHLKLEVSHPTRTVKDRITELVYSYFNAHGIRRYAHCSAGNAGTSLVWGAGRLPGPFTFDSFIPEHQLPYHNFGNPQGLTVALVEGASYEEAKKYCSWYAREVIDQPEYMSFKSDLRRQANKLPYLEAFEQAADRKVEIDFVCQAISDGGGIVGADLAASDALSEGWIARKPRFVVAQPRAANPVVRCFRKGYSSYRASCTLEKLGPSRAFAIRRRDASGYYESLHSVLREGGLALDATERSIRAAKEALRDLEGIDAGYTASTSLAAIWEENRAGGSLKGRSVLVMITGADRPTDVVPRIDRVVPKAEWKKIVERS